MQRTATVPFTYGTVTVTASVHEPERDPEHIGLNPARMDHRLDKGFGAVVAAASWLVGNLNANAHRSAFLTEQTFTQKFTTDVEANKVELEVAVTHSTGIPIGDVSRLLGDCFADAFENLVKAIKKPVPADLELIRALGALALSTLLPEGERFAGLFSRMRGGSSPFKDYLHDNPFIQDEHLFMKRERYEF